MNEFLTELVMVISLNLSGCPDCVLYIVSDDGAIMQEVGVYGSMTQSEINSYCGVSPNLNNCVVMKSGNVGKNVYELGKWD